MKTVYYQQKSFCIVDGLMQLSSSQSLPDLMDIVDKVINAISQQHTTGYK